jgi:hypothetical protein
VKVSLRILTLGAVAIVGVPAAALATPSTTYWAPSVATCQAFATPHITYDTYYGKDAGYPVDTGLTMGVIPSDKIQAEVGYDLLYPGDPTQFYLNGKLCLPENSIGKGWPAIGGGIYNLGFHGTPSTTDDPAATNYNMIYLMVQKTLPFGGYISGGVYHGTSAHLFTNSEGEVKKTGGIFGWSSPDIKFDLTGLSKMTIIADVQTGKNVFGGGGVGVDIYFNDYIALITGPVWYTDKELQPGGKSWLWTTQIDVDIPLGRKKP